MRLAGFIDENIEPILAEWDKFARSLAPGENMTLLALRDDAESILRHTARDMQNRQSLSEQSSKSKGDGGADSKTSDQLDSISELHGVDRASSGFHITDVVAEYRALRASVVRLWRESHPQPKWQDVDDLTRFHESLDQSLAGAVGSYSKRVDDSRKMFLAILSHDLRDPLHSIRMITDLVEKKQVASDADVVLSTLRASTMTMTQLISDLIDFASSALGRTMPLSRGAVDLEELCSEVLSGYRASHPKRTLRFHSEGDVNGVWDAGRLRQVISNLIGNAIQYGAPEKPIALSVASEGSIPEESTVVLVVHNEGEPIPPDLLPAVFDPLISYASPDAAKHRRAGSMGLGLYIVREIVFAKGGTVEVTSTAEQGTTFTVCIPRILPVGSENQDDAKAAKYDGTAATGKKASVRDDPERGILKLFTG